MIVKDELKKLGILHAVIDLGMVEIFEEITKKKREQLAKKLLPQVYSGQMRNNSLYKGDVGIGVLLTELDHPQFARMPLFE